MKYVRTTRGGRVSYAPKRERSSPVGKSTPYGTEWIKERKLFLLDNPLCVMCSDQGFVVAATVVDHVVPHKGDPMLFWDKANWQSLCAPHHNRTKQGIERHGYSTDVGADGWPSDPNHNANRGG